jgi:hypothetical protein
MAKASRSSRGEGSGMALPSEEADIGCFFINFHKRGAAARNVVMKPNGICHDLGRR